MTVARDVATLGAVIRQERKRQGLTQLDLATYSGVGINFLSNIERGKETAEIGKVMAVLNTLGLVIAVERRSAWRKLSKYLEPVVID